MALEVTQILLNAQSADGPVRKAAEESLKQFQEQNLPGFLLTLSQELASHEKPPDSRRLAGLILKNSLDAKDEARKAQLSQAWVNLEPHLRSQIKAFLLQTLSSPVPDASHTAAQVIAKVAGIELPLGEWPELVAALLANMTVEAADPAAASSPWLKQSTLETLGYVCEEVPPNVLAQDQVNAILTAVVQGMTAADSGGDVRLVATKALYNALDFAQSNFENDGERNYLMRVVCEAALSPDPRVRQVAFECLVSIASCYYEKLSPYMKDIFAITSKAVREDEEPVALQAIEFWSSTCEEEIEILNDYGADFSDDSEVPCFKFIEKALPALVPLLLETLTKQEEDQAQEDGAWNLSMAGGTCLGLVARTVGDNIVSLVMPFVQDNILKPDWRLREAATYAFGSILEGPSEEKLAPLVQMALEFMLKAMKDENDHVKDTTAWTLSRIFECLHGPDSEIQIITPANLPSIVEALLGSVKEAPNVAEKVCGAIYFLAQGYGEDEGGSATPLSPFFQSLVQALLYVADRDDSHFSRLRASAYETLNEVIRCSAEDTAPLLVQLMPAILHKLLVTLEIQVSTTEEREKQGELQALLCGVLQVMIQKMGTNEVTKQCIFQYADQMMALFLRVFACRSATVHEEAMLTIGALAHAIGADFVKHMPELYKYLEMGLQNFEEYQVCAITVGVVGDICQALESKVLPYCDGIMTELLKALSSMQLQRSVKPRIFSCFGDIALAIGEYFEKYLVYAMPMLQAAAELSAKATGGDDEMAEYNNELRNGIFEAYSGLFQGFKKTKADLMLPYASHALRFIESVYQDTNRDDAVTKAAVGVLGDLADSLGAHAAGLFQSCGFYQNFLAECVSSDDKLLKETAEWAEATLQRALSG